RHTRSKRDWSSDVCSSDLINVWFECDDWSGHVRGIADFEQYRLCAGEGVGIGGGGLDRELARGCGHIRGPPAGVENQWLPINLRSEERRVGKGGRTRSEQQ